jgi:hypothetical protein
MRNPTLRRWRRGLIACYLGAVAAGVVAFARSTPPTPATDAYLSPAGPARDADLRVNWASMHGGARARASIWDHFRGHHPLFAIDGEAQPAEIEKWASLATTPSPWIEILLPGLHDVEEVVIRHAGWRERAAYTNRRYTVRCFRGEQSVAEVAVADNTAAVARHPIDCRSTDRVVVAFDCTIGEPVARIYEVEAWGR